MEEGQHSLATPGQPDKKKRIQLWPTPAHETAFGCPRDFLQNRFVYVVVSARARGLSVGINMNPDKQCNFDCVYCEVHRNEAPREQQLDVDVMARELRNSLALIREGHLRERPWFQSLPDDLLRLRHVTL